MRSLSSALAELWLPQLTGLDDFPVPPEPSFIYKRLSPSTAVPAINTTVWTLASRCILTDTDKASAKSGEPEHVLHFPVSHDSLNPAYVRIVVYSEPSRKAKVELVSRFRRPLGRFYKQDTGLWQFTSYSVEAPLPILSAYERLRVREILRLQDSQGSVLPSIVWGEHDSFKLPAQAPLVISVKDANPPDYD